MEFGPIPALTPVEKLEEDCYDWYARHREKQQASSGEYEIVLIGDSITHFWENMRGPESYKETFGAYKVLNLGFGFDRTGNVLYRLTHGEFPQKPPRLIVMNIGTNNFASSTHYPGDTPEGVAQGIAACAELLRKFAPASRLLVMKVFPRGKFQQEIRKCNALLPALLPAGTEILDLTQALQLPDKAEIDPRFYGGDGTHLNEAGYRVWGAALKPYLTCR